MTDHLVMAQPDSLARALLNLKFGRASRDMHHMAGLVAAILQGHGQSVRQIRQTGRDKSEVETDDYLLRIAQGQDQFSITMRYHGLARADCRNQTEIFLAHLVRALATVLRPVSICWRDSNIAIETRRWMSILPPVRPRKVLRSMQKIVARPKAGGVPVWPLRPQDVQTMPHLEAARRAQKRADRTARMYAAWTPNSGAEAGETHPRRGYLRLVR